MSKQQPDALRLAAMLTADEWPGSVTLVSYARECVAELLRQHARIAELEAQIEAVGAGGVSGPLVGRAALSANAGGPVAWLESEPSTKDWPVRNLFFGFTSFAYSSRLHMGEKPKGADQSQNRFTPLYAAPPTAQAEGFRDGVASVAANAGSEPIAWLVCTEEGDPSMVFLDQREAQMFLEDDERPTPLYTHPSPTSAEVVEHG